MAKFYITTAIDYPSGSPHLGHAYEKICTDIIARWKRLKGDDVFFLTGTDEHGQKIQKKAEEAGKTPKQYVDQTVKKFQELCKKLNISNDRFIRTTDKDHEKVAQELLQTVYDKGDIYKGEYEGLYCTDCETYYLEKDLNGNKCPIHDKKVENVKEESYFFKMSKYQDKFLKHLEKNQDFIRPESKRNEIINRIKEGVRDLSVSRTSFNWGVPVPFDKKHVQYVWFDALSNYISGIDYPNGKNFKKYWPADIHVIGKDIVWHHTMIWCSMLLSAGIDLPKMVFVHGFINLKGEKLSKAKGIIVDPIELTNKYGSDALKYYLIKNVPFGDDGDFSEEALISSVNNELANDLGNLVSRSLAMTEKYYGGKVPKGKNELNFDIKRIETLLDNLELTQGLSEIWKLVNELNKYVNDKKPWEVENKDNIIYTILDNMRIISILLSPFLPETIEKINCQLGIKTGKLKETKPNLLKPGTKTIKGEILFKKHE
ncbi:MAG: methionine--tRNA ligase [Candidatus Nanoarchaeia archaeon]|nr:methionine--tRNA ligase [Candidatus Nanoarchaeia archaeon]